MSDSDPDSNNVQPLKEPIQPKETIQTKGPISKKPLIVFIIASIVMLILGVSAAAYTALVINSPERIWDQALQNTSDGFNELSQTLQEKPINGGAVEGSFTSVAPLASTAVVSGKWYEREAIFNGDIDVSGIQATGEMRVVDSDSAEKSEVYIKIDGLESAASILSLVEPELATTIPTINGVWYKIDETVASDSVQDEDINTNLSSEELSDISVKLSSAINDRLFTMDDSMAVFVVSEPVGREEFNGVDTYKYNVAVQKQPFLDFLAEVQKALEGTQLQGLLVQNMLDNGDVNSLDEITKRFQDADFATMRAEVWVDMDMKYFRNVRITLPDSPSSDTGYVDLGLDYEGGDELPFRMHIVTESNTVNNGTIDLLLQAAFNKETTVSKLSFTLSGTTDSQQIAASGELLITPSEEVVEVEAPAGAKNISELLSIIMGLNSTGSTSGEFNTIDINSYRLDDVEL